MEQQQTIVKSTKLSGWGLFSGQPATVTFRPAPANHGLVFVRKDLGHAAVAAIINNVIKKSRRTALRSGDAVVDTCEHCLSAIAGSRIDNLIIEVDGMELPAMDGSAKPYIDVLLEAGIQTIDVPRHRLQIADPVVVRHDDAIIAAVPCSDPELQVLYELNYGASNFPGRQLCVFDMNNGDYLHEIAPARTYVLESEAKSLQERGIGLHLTTQDILVIGENGPLGGNEFRFPDELVRHKIVDLIGDLCLLGAPIHGRIIAYKSGHSLNHALVRKLTGQLRSQVHHQLATQSNVADIRQVMRILPHRYPMLLVDRVIELDGDRRAVGVKNVSINEPFFQGHYPGTPIMPGVLVVEAMAQLSGVLFSQNLQQTGKLAILMSLDRVKLRKPVIPGDQLILQAETIKVRTHVAHTRCRAYVAEELVAEAEVKFMLVDEEQK